MVKIKCPNCGAVLSVKEVSGLNEKVIRCPVCGERQPFSKYKELKPVSEDDTELYKSDSAKGEDETEINTGGKENTVIVNSGYLFDMNTQKKYSLKDGVNYVGRSAVSTPEKVNVRIDTSDMGFSRSHLRLEVVKSAEVRKYKVSIDACKNLTFLNGEKMEKMDVFFLKDGDTIKSSNVELQFRLN